EVLPRTIFFALQPLTRAPCSAASEFTHLRGALCGAKTNRINRSLLLLNLPLARIPLPQVQFQNGRRLRRQRLLRMKQPRGAKASASRERFQDVATFFGMEFCRGRFTLRMEASRSGAMLISTQR